MVLIDQPGVLLAARPLAHLVPFLDEVVTPRVAQGAKVVGADGRKIILDYLAVTTHLRSPSLPGYDENDGPELSRTLAAGLKA